MLQNDTQSVWETCNYKSRLVKILYTGSYCRLEIRERPCLYGKQKKVKMSVRLKETLIGMRTELEKQLKLSGGTENEENCLRCN